MALENLATDLTKLKYTGVPPTVTFDQGLGRTGAESKTLSGHQATQLNSRTNDVKRIAKIMTQTPGLKFAGNQAILKSANIVGSYSQAKNQGKTAAGAVLAGLKTAFQATVGTGLFLTANVGKAGTGYHGINPSVGLGYLGDTPASEGGGFLGKVINTVSKVASAIGAQSNNYHAGREIIGGAQFVSKKGTDNPLYSGRAAEQGSTKIPVGNLKPEKTATIRSKTFNESFDADVPKDQKYFENKENRLDSYYVTKPKDETVPEYERGNKNDIVQSLAVQTETILGSDQEDIIPFEFNFYTPGQNTDRYIYFRAFLDSLSDSYTGTWSGTKYVGRAEEFFTYSGFGRSISFVFKVAAFSKDELKPIYTKLNHIVGATAPTYGDGLFMRGTLLSLTIGDYIVNQNGFLGSVSLTWNTDYQWEISKDEYRVPHVLDVQCEFTPIHSFNPEYGDDNKRFIGKNA